MNFADYLRKSGVSEKSKRYYISKKMRCTIS